MIRLIQRRLIIPQGDTGIFSIPVLPTMQSGDVAVFTIFKSTSKIYEKVMTQLQDVLTIHFKHEDTINFPVGKYYWDVKIYKDTKFNDKQELIDGKEIDSYYAAYKLPICEVRSS